VSQFVEQCRREWSRLGVPAAFANEMAADLEADLAEARADGVSPEEVLGNGYFDAACFAASWAIARGVVSVKPRDRTTVQVRSLVLACCTLVGAVVAGVGFLILVRPRFGSQAVAASVAQRFNRPLPPIVVRPRTFVLSGAAGGNIDPLGWALLAIGILGLVAVLWIWRPWSGPRDGTRFDQNIGMPSFL
jgi:hypothetical protein